MWNSKIWRKKLTHMVILGSIWLPSCHYFFYTFPESPHRLSLFLLPSSWQLLSRKTFDKLCSWPWPNLHSRGEEENRDSDLYLVLPLEIQSGVQSSSIPGHMTDRKQPCLSTYLACRDILVEHSETVGSFHFQKLQKHWVYHKSWKYYVHARKKPPLSKFRCIEPEKYWYLSIFPNTNMIFRFR